MIVLEGSLEGLGFIPLVRFLADIAQTGTLHIAHHDWHGDVLFEDGCPVAAEVGGEGGLAALDFIALALDGGEFAFRDDLPPLEANLALGTAELLVHLEALQASRAGLAGGIPPPNAVPRFADDVPDETKILISHQTLAVLLQIDGKRTVQEIAARHGLRVTLEALVAVAEFGWIVIDSAQPTPSEVPACPPPENDLNSLPQPWRPVRADHPVTWAAAAAVKRLAARPLLDAEAWARWAPWGLPLAVGVVTLLIHGHRLSAAPDIFADEGLYLQVGNNLARGAGLLAPGGSVFFWHPPVYLIVEAIYIKLTRLSEVDPVTALFSVRWLNVFFSAATAVLLLLLGRRLHSYKAGLLMAGMFLLDPYVQRINRRGMLETLAMLLALIGIYLFYSTRQRLSVRKEMFAGVAFGLAMLTKELMLFELLAVLAFVVWSRRSQLANALKISAIACCVYLIYPVWAIAIGQGDAYFSLKLERLAVFLNWSKYSSLLSGQTGPTPEGVLATGSGTPFLANVLAVFGQYATSYSLIAAGAFFTAVLLVKFRAQLTARYLATWSATSYAFLGFGLVFGALSDQFFYYLIVPSITVTSFVMVEFLAYCWRAWKITSQDSVWLHQQKQSGVWTRSYSVVLNSSATTIVLIAFVSLVSYDVSQWFSKYSVGTDNSYATIFSYVRTNIPAGESISVGDDVANYFLPGYRIEFHRNPQSVIAMQTRLFILSSKDPWGGYDGMTPAFYSWVLSESRPLIEEEGNTFWKLGLYYRDPSQDQAAIRTERGRT